MQKTALLKQNTALTGPKTNVTITQN